MALTGSTPEDELAPRPGLGNRLLGRLRDSLAEPEQVLALLLLAAFAARAVWLTTPNSLIFDEAYYVNASRVILGWEVPVNGNYRDSSAGIDPNVEHPPLGKVLMAGSMAVFGDNGLGWRLPSILAGLLALVALYLIVRAAGESRWLAILAATIFAFDNLSLVHGRIGTLDMLVLAPILLAAWAGLRGRWLLAGAFAGLGFLVKLTALYGLLALLVMAALAALATWRTEQRMRIGRAEVRPAVSAVAGFLLVAAAGLWALDARFTTYANPLDHVRHMLEYGANLTKPGGPPSLCRNNDSAPWQWLANDCEMIYFRVTTDTKVDDVIIATRADIDFRGAMNPALLGAMAFAIPFGLWQAIRQRNRLATWALVWLGASYLPIVALAFFGHRITYIYYFLPLVPALGALIAAFLLRSGLPRAVLWGYLAAYAFGFAAYFPFRHVP